MSKIVEIVKKAIIEYLEDGYKLQRIKLHPKTYYELRIAMEESCGYFPLETLVVSDRFMLFGIRVDLDHTTSENDIILIGNETVDPFDHGKYYVRQTLERFISTPKHD